jgi:hypothetical protein
MATKWNQCIATLVGTILCLGSSAGTQAYEEIEVRDGGTLAGSVALLGDVPKPKGYNLVTFPDPVYCGRISNGAGWRLLQPFDVGPNGEFRQVVIMVVGVEQGKPFPDSRSKIEAVDCTFAPYISVVPEKRPLEIVNMDPVLHDAQAYETSRLGARVLFNSPLPMNPQYTKEGIRMTGRNAHFGGPSMTQRIEMHKGRRVFIMQCGFHAYMESWGFVADSPYYAVTDREGRFQISDIPAGSYKMLVWHPMIYGGAGQQYEMTIKPRDAVRLDAKIEAPVGRLYANQLEENPRFGIEMMGDMKIVPSVEKQTY